MYLAVAEGNSKWDAVWTKYAGYNEEDILPIFHLMFENVASSVDNVCFRKYDGVTYFQGNSQRNIL